MLIKEVLQDGHASELFRIAPAEWLPPNRQSDRGARTGDGRCQMERAVK